MLSAPIKAALSSYLSSPDAPGARRCTALGIEVAAAVYKSRMICGAGFGPYQNYASYDCYIFAHGSKVSD